jgi:hypothetical protein
MTTKLYGLQEVLKALESVMGERDDDLTCVICGCTDDHAYPEGCFWVAPGVCSACFDKCIVTLRLIVDAMPEEIRVPQYREHQPVMTDFGAVDIEVIYRSGDGFCYKVSGRDDHDRVEKHLLAESEIRLIGEEDHANV